MATPWFLVNSSKAAASRRDRWILGRQGSPASGGVVGSWETRGTAGAARDSFSRVKVLGLLGIPQSEPGSRNSSCSCRSKEFYTCIAQKAVLVRCWAFCCLVIIFWQGAYTKERERCVGLVLFCSVSFCGKVKWDDGCCLGITRSCLVLKVKKKKEKKLGNLNSSMPGEFSGAPQTMMLARHLPIPIRLPAYLPHPIPSPQPPSIPYEANSSRKTRRDWRGGDSLCVCVLRHGQLCSSYGL